LESKDALRKHFRQLDKKWREVKGAELANEQAKLTLNLVEFLNEERGLWCGYQALSDEASVAEAMDKTSHITWAFPKVSGLDLSFWIPKQQSSFLVGAFGIQEPPPESSQHVDFKQVCGLLIPGQAFDRRGQRLGRGKSFYDRALQQFKGLKVGVCFSPRVSEADLPTDAWDIGMDFVITEKQVIRSSATKE
jgi:5-formyltetrahydrofolate cyclo-ligase